MLRVAIIALVLLCAPPAQAEDALPDTIGAPVTLTLDLTGTIATHCGFAALPPTTANLGDLNTAGSLALPFTMDCNVPFAMKIASGNGALNRTVAASAPSGFATTLDYAIAVSVDTDLTPVSAECAASALASCVLGAGLSSGDGVGIGTAGSLTLGWAPPTTRLVAGAYRDQITLTVEVRS